MHGGVRGVVVGDPGEAATAKVRVGFAEAGAAVLLGQLLRVRGVGAAVGSDDGGLVRQHPVHQLRNGAEGGPRGGRPLPAGLPRHFLGTLHPRLPEVLLRLSLPVPLPPLVLQLEQVQAPVLQCLRIQFAAEHRPFVQAHRHNSLRLSPRLHPGVAELAAEGLRGKLSGLLQPVLLLPQAAMRRAEQVFAPGDHHVRLSFLQGDRPCEEH